MLPDSVMHTTDIKARVYDLLKDFSTAMFVTVDGDGSPGARPMHIVKVEDEGGRIWFFTGRSGTLAREIEHNAVILLAFQKDNSAYLSLRGEARVAQNLGRIKELWNEAYKVWFPGGPTDPEIALVSVKPISAEYWDNRGTNKLEYLFQAAKAYVKGEKPDLSDADQHSKTAL